MKYIHQYPLTIITHCVPQEGMEDPSQEPMNTYPLLEHVNYNIFTNHPDKKTQNIRMNIQINQDEQQ